MQVILNDPAQAHKVIQKLWVDAKTNLLAGRKQVLEMRDFEDTMTDKQRRYYHGYILTEIARQARVEGVQHAMPIWKEHFRKTYLGKKRVRDINPITGKKSYRWERVSTEGLGVKGYNELIDRVTAFATMELNVNFYEDFDIWTAEKGVII
jgi:NinB protein